MTEAEYDTPHHATASLRELRALLAKREHHLAELIDEVRYAEGRRAEAVRLAESRAAFAHKLEAALQGMMRLYLTRSTNDDGAFAAEGEEEEKDRQGRVGSAQDTLQAALKELLYEGIGAETRPLVTRTLAQLTIRSRSASTPRRRSIASATSALPAATQASSPSSPPPSPARRDKYTLKKGTVNGNEAKVPASSLMHTQAELSALLASLQQEAASRVAATQPPWLPPHTHVAPSSPSSSLLLKLDSHPPRRAAPAPMSGRSSASTTSSTIPRYNSTQSPHSPTHASPYTSAPLSAERPVQPGGAYTTTNGNDDGTPYRPTALHGAQHTSNVVAEDVGQARNDDGEDDASPSYRRPMVLLSPAPLDAVSRQPRGEANIRVLSTTAAASSAVAALPGTLDAEPNHIHSLEAVVRSLKSDLQVMQERVNTSIA